MRAACADEGLYATDLAEALVRAGVPFREAHARTGSCCGELRDDGTRAARADRRGVERVRRARRGGALLDPDTSVAARGGPGGPSPASVIAQADALERS